MLRCNLSFDLMTSQVGRFFFAQMINQYYSIWAFFASLLWPMVKKWRAFQNTSNRREKKAKNEILEFWS